MQSRGIFYVGFLSLVVYFVVANFMMVMSDVAPWGQLCLFPHVCMFVFGLQGTIRRSAAAGERFIDFIVDSRAVRAWRDQCQ